MTEIKNSILAGLAFGLLLGLFFAVRFDTHYALIAGPISGLAFGAALYFFVTSKTVKKQVFTTHLDLFLMDLQLQLLTDKQKNSLLVVDDYGKKELKN